MRCALQWKYCQERDGRDGPEFRGDARDLSLIHIYNYLIKYVHHDEAGEMKTEIRRPIADRMPLPTGKRENVIEYFLDPALKYKR